MVLRSHSCTNKETLVFLPQVQARGTSRNLIVAVHLLDCDRQLSHAMEELGPRSIRLDQSGDCKVSARPERRALDRAKFGKITKNLAGLGNLCGRSSILYLRGLSTYR